MLIAGFAALALAMAIGATLAAYHAGVEWHLWPGPQECSGDPNFGRSGSLLEQLNTVIVVRCDEAAWRLFGISLAGYNVVISVALACVALWGLRMTIRRAPR
jgi:disulfide bond formation protein DsbB